jgi:hypothetical protein
MDARYAADWIRTIDGENEFKAWAATLPEGRYTLDEFGDWLVGNPKYQNYSQGRIDAIIDELILQGRIEERDGRLYFKK